MTRPHMGGCLSMRKTVLNSLCHSFYHPAVNILSTSVKIVNNVYNLNFEISKQGITACATLSSLLPNHTESSSLVSILLTAAIARSTSLKGAALLNCFCSAQKFLVTNATHLLSLELSRLRPCSKYRGVNFSSFLHKFFFVYMY